MSREEVTLGIATTILASVLQLEGWKLQLETEDPGEVIRKAAGWGWQIYRTVAEEAPDAESFRSLQSKLGGELPKAA